MGKLKNDQNGFSAVEAVLIIVIAGMIGFVGWYVYRAMKNTNNAYSSSLADSTGSSAKFKHKSSKKGAANADPTANWTTVKSPDASFTFKLPQSWVSLTCEKSGGSASTVYIASSQSYLAACQSDNTGEADLDMRADNSASAAPQKQSTDQSFTSESFTANGIKGYKATEVTAVDDALLPNTKIITYSFFSNGKSFYASYRQPSNGKDDTAVFEQIVQTWKF
jgi:cytoskeletal protein RodZ